MSNLQIVSAISMDILQSNVDLLLGEGIGQVWANFFKFRARKTEEISQRVRIPTSNAFSYDICKLLNLNVEIDLF